MKSIKHIYLYLSLAVFAISSVALTRFAVTSWSIDKAHSAINFKIIHFFTPITGSFNDYDATIYFDPNNLKESSIDVSIPVKSVDTKNEKRDGHLQTADFFDAEKYPNIVFKSSKIEALGDNKFVAKGALTIKDVTKDFDLPFTLLGVKDHPMMPGKLVAGITSTFEIKRDDFGVGSGNFASDAVVGNVVTADLTLELHTDK